MTERPDSESARLHNALRAHLRQEFVAPAAAIVGFADIVIEDAERAGLSDYAADLDRIRSAGPEPAGAARRGAAAERRGRRHRQLSHQAAARSAHADQRRQRLWRDDRGGCARQRSRFAVARPSKSCSPPRTASWNASMRWSRFSGRRLDRRRTAVLRRCVPRGRRACGRAARGSPAGDRGPDPRRSTTMPPTAICWRASSPAMVMRLKPWRPAGRGWRWTPSVPST